MNNKMLLKSMNIFVPLFRINFFPPQWTALVSIITPNRTDCNVVLNRLGFCTGVGMELSNYFS